MHQASTSVHTARSRKRMTPVDGCTTSIVAVALRATVEPSRTAPVLLATGCDREADSTERSGSAWLASDRVLPPHPERVHGRGGRSFGTGGGVDVDGGSSVVDVGGSSVVDVGGSVIVVGGGIEPASTVRGMTAKLG